QLGGDREHRDVGCVADLAFGIAAEETDESDSVEVHTFLLFCPPVSGTRKRVGAAPKTRSCFSGGTGTGEPEPERCRRQSRSFAGAGRRKSPEAVPRQRVEQETDPKQSRNGWSQQRDVEVQREIARASSAFPWNQRRWSRSRHQATRLPWLLWKPQAGPPAAHRDRRTMCVAIVHA